MMMKKKNQKHTQEHTRAVYQELVMMIRIKNLIQELTQAVYQS